MRNILIFVTLFVYVCARPRIFGEEGVLHKTAQKIHETGEKVVENIQNTLQDAKAKVQHGIADLEEKIHNKVSKILKGNEEDDKTKNVEITEVEDNKKHDTNKDTTVVVVDNEKTDITHDKIPDEVPQYNPDVFHATHDTKLNADYDKLNELLAKKDFKHKTTNNNAENDDGADHFQVIFDKNGQAVVVPIINKTNSNTRPRGRKNNELEFTNKQIPEDESNYANKIPVEEHVEKRVAHVFTSRSELDHRNRNSIDVRSDD